MRALDISRGSLHGNIGNYAVVEEVANNHTRLAEVEARILEACEGVLVSITTMEEP
jgi:hypothetical protein